MPLAMVFEVPPVPWMVKARQELAFFQPLGRQQIGDLVGFATQADHQHRCEIGVHRITAQCAPQHRQGFAAGVHGTAEAVGQGNNPVDIGIVDQGLWIDIPAEVIGDGLGHGRRAVDRRQDADVIAGGDPAIGSHDAHEGVAGLRADTAGVDTKGVIAGEVAHHQIVHMHMLPGPDRLAGEADRSDRSGAAG